MDFVTKRFTIELPDRLKGFVGVREERRGVVISLLTEEDPACSGVLAVIKAYKRKKPPKYDGEITYIGRLLSESGEELYLYALFGTEGSCSEENEELYFRICDRLFPAFDALRPAKGFELQR